MITAEIYPYEEGFGFALTRDGAVFQRQDKGSNSEVYTKEEAEKAAEEALNYWQSLDETVLPPEQSPIVP